MENKEHRVVIDWFGKEIVLSTGKMAKQANGSILAECDNTVVLATATMGKNAVEDPGFFPLSVHYMEKFYAKGKIPGGFIKREGKPSDKAVLTSRIIDRSLRPLFPEGFRSEVQVIPNVISVGDVFSPDTLAVLASSAALFISDIPFENPVACVRVFIIDGKPTLTQIHSEEKLETNLDLLISGNKDGVTMVEGISNIITNESMIEALELGFSAIQKLIKAQEDLRVLAGKPKLIPTLFVTNKELEEGVKVFASDKIKASFSLRNKLERYAKMDEIFSEVEKNFTDIHEDPKIGKKAKEIAHDLEYYLVRDHLFSSNTRVDGRKPDEIRPINIEVGLFKRLHGSALFTRGETQSLGVLTLGSGEDAQRLDDIESGESSKNYMLHYNFPPFSVGEVGKVMAPGRREIGHGYLAEKALKAIIPPQSEFPYTIRLVSEILESNGSSSMASVCSGSLALMDGGVPVKENVAGIAMGLMFNEDKSDYKILTDIQGLEDHYGDIDFKVAGTKDGITAFQLDIKMDAVSIDILKQALQEALKARLVILDKMNKVISTPRTDLSSFAPKVFTIMANPDNIRYLIGPGGKTIKALTEEFGVNIDILQTGEIRILAPSEEVAERAKKKILFMVRDIKVGDIIEGVVIKITAFGAFIEVAAGREGLCHISKLSQKRVETVEEILSEGMTVKVKVLEIDKQGKISLSLKDA